MTRNQWTWVLLGVTLLAAAGIVANLLWFAPHSWGRGPDHLHLLRFRDARRSWPLRARLLSFFATTLIFRSLSARRGRI